MLDMPHTCLLQCPEYKQSEHNLWSKLARGHLDLHNIAIHTPVITSLFNWLEIGMQEPRSLHITGALDFKCFMKFVKLKDIRLSFLLQSSGDVTEQRASTSFLINTLTFATISFWLFLSLTAILMYVLLLFLPIALTIFLLDGVTTNFFVIFLYPTEI